MHVTKIGFKEMWRPGAHQPDSTRTGPDGGREHQDVKEKLGGEPGNIEKLCAMGYYLQTGAHEHGLVSALRKKLGPTRA